MARTILNGQIDFNGVERVNTIDDLDPYPLRCAAKVFHPWDGATEFGKSDDWPGIDARTITEHCACGRWRRRTVNNRNGELLSVAYGGGQMVMVGTRDSRAAFLLWMQRQRKALVGAGR